MFVQLKDVSKIYETGKVKFKALDSVNTEINEGDIAVILGPSGSGKSTMLNAIGGVDTIDNGEIIIDSKKITDFNDKQLTEYRRNKIGFIFQFYNLVPNLTVYENVEVAENISENPKSVDEILEAVGMLELKNRFPRELSGGQQQRVSIARALVKNPKLLLCDEPTGALDYKTSKDVLVLLEEMNKKYGTTIVIITHNDSITAMAHKIIKLRSGVIVKDVRNENVLPAERIEW